MATDAPLSPLVRGGISFCVILTSLMQALDTTIANIALPHMQGTVSASQDQINWVLTSYIVAAAIFTAPTGFLARRFGVKRVYVVAVTGFTLASALCGMAATLPQIVLFRLLQGAFGAALVPLAQTTMLDITPREMQGRSMALWGMAAMIGPIMGPVLGGWITSSYSWRWCFYINLPIGAVALAGILFLMPNQHGTRAARLDWFGFLTLSLAIGALQLMLDRGQQLDWFSSPEIMAEAIVAGTSIYLFLAHTVTSSAPFLRLAIFKDRNFAAGLLTIFVISGAYFASFALLTPYLQHLMGYPVITAGMVMGPRGLAMMVTMMFIGRLMGRVNIRLVLTTGILLTAWSLYEMIGWTPDVSFTTVALNGAVQGTGLGFLMVPISTMTLGTLAPQYRAEGASLFSLMRNVGASIGISGLTALLARNIQVNHSELAEHVTSRMALPPVSALSPFSPVGRAALDALVNREAAVIAYMDDFKLMMILVLASLPLVLLFRGRGPGGIARAPVE